MEQILRFAGYACVAVNNGREALDSLVTTRVDLVLLDLSMPVMDGYRTTSLIRQMPLGATLPIIAVTAHALGTARENAMDAGFTDYLTKPFGRAICCASSSGTRTFPDREEPGQRGARHDRVPAGRHLLLLVRSFWMDGVV